MSKLFNKTKEFEEEVKPLLDMICSKCNCLGIPMYFTAAIKNDENGTEYASELLSAQAAQVELKDNKLVDFVNVMNGFEVHPPRRIMEIDY